MSRPYSAFRILGYAAVIVAGLGIGFWAARRWSANPPRSQESSATDSPAAPHRTIEQHRAIEQDDRPKAKGSGKHALLIGVTKYDNLPTSLHLSGPANDVRLMRRLLEGDYQFPPDSIVSLTENEGVRERRPTRANIAREFRRLAELAHEGDQVVILLAGHGAQQPESDPPDPRYPEPDGIDEIFLPADVKKWDRSAEGTSGARIQRHHR